MIFQLNHYHRRAFSLVEVLLAVFILGIGLIMVATVFPVGADWTRQSTESSIAQVVAQNAIGVIRTHYGPGGNLYGTGVGLDALPAVTPGASSPLAALPGLIDTTKIKLTERCYQFGSSQPFPAANPNNCTYFWTAVARRSAVAAGHNATLGKSYDVYVLVCHKGAIEQTYTPPASELANSRNLPAENFVPAIVNLPYLAGTYNNARGVITGATPAVGDLGIGLDSGTVFRQTVALIGGLPFSAVASPPRSSTGGADTNILYVPPADGNTSGSPLVYVYQTTISQ